MNILFLTRRFLPDVGGVETHVLKVAEQLIKDGHSVVVVTESQEHENGAEKGLKRAIWRERYINANSAGKVKEIAISGKSADLIGGNSSVRANSSAYEKNTNKEDLSGKIIVYRIPKVNEGRTKKLIIWKWLWQHRHLFKNADVIHCHDVFFWYMPFKLFDQNKKAFITFHGYEGVYPPARKAVFIRKLSERMADGNICVGDFIKKWYGTKPDFVTYGGVSGGENRNAKSEKDNKNKKLRILFLGRLEKDTGIDMYLDGVKELKKQAISFKFEVCGDGSWRKNAEKLGTVYGFVPDPAPYIQSADVVFVSSYLSILQGLYYGKLVISVYDNPLKEDYLKLAPFSLYVQIISSSKNMSNIIDQFVRDEARFVESRRMGHEWAAKQTWANVTELYYRLWQVKR